MRPVLSCEKAAVHSNKREEARPTTRSRLPRPTRSRTFAMFLIAPPFLSGRMNFQATTRGSSCNVGPALFGFDRTAGIWPEILLERQERRYWLPRRLHWLAQSKYERVSARISLATNLAGASGSFCKTGIESVPIGAAPSPSPYICAPKYHADIFKSRRIRNVPVKNV